MIPRLTLQPGRGLSVRSRWAFHLRGSDLTPETVGGTPLIFGRPSTSEGRDVGGATFTVPVAVPAPRWRSGALTWGLGYGGDPDDLSGPFVVPASRGVLIFADLYLGTTGDQVIAHIGSGDLGEPGVTLRRDSGVFQLRVEDDSGTRTAPAPSATVAVGDRVRLYGFADPGTSTVRLDVRVNDGAWQVGTPAASLDLPAAWDALAIQVGSLDGAAGEPMELRALKVHAFTELLTPDRAESWI